MKKFVIGEYIQKSSFVSILRNRSTSKHSKLIINVVYLYRVQNVVLCLAILYPDLYKINK